MIVVVKHGASEKQIENLTNWFKAKGVEPDVSKGTDMTIIGLVGDVSKIDTELVEALDIVDSVKRVSEPFKQANRKFHPDDTVVTLKNGTKIGAPYVNGATVTATLLKTGKGKKVTVWTYKPKKGSQRKMGHRQFYTQVRIEAINA